MNTLHFILGLANNEAEYQNLANVVSNYYKGHIPGLINVKMYRWQDDVFSAIQSTQPSGELVLAGFSFGGRKAVDTCNQLNGVGRKVNHLILFDPVNWEKTNGPNLTDFTLPSNVVEAICLYREALTSGPWSAPIRNAPSTRFKNVLLGTTHGEQVWAQTAIDYTTTALNGGQMVPSAGPVPTPTPIPTPVDNPVISITLNYKDGSHKTVSV